MFKCKRFKFIVNIPTNIPDTTVETTGTLVLWLIRENILGIIPSCDNAYNKRGIGIAVITEPPKKYSNVALFKLYCRVVRTEGHTRFIIINFPIDSVED